jgi:hypothetical protein
MAEETSKRYTVGDLRKMFGVHGKELPIFRNKEGKTAAPSTLDDVLTHKAAQALYGHIYGKSLQSPSMPDPANPKGSWIPTPARADTEDITDWYHGLVKSQTDFRTKHEKNLTATSHQKTAIAGATPAPQKKAQIGLAAKLKAKQAVQATAGAHAVQQALPGKEEKEKPGVIDVPTLIHVAKVTKAVDTAADKEKPKTRAEVETELGPGPPKTSSSSVVQTPPSGNEPSVSSTAFMAGAHGTVTGDKRGLGLRGKSRAAILGTHRFSGLPAGIGITPATPEILDPTKGAERPDLQAKEIAKAEKITAEFAKTTSKISTPKGIKPGTVEYSPVERTYANPSKGAAGGYTPEFHAKIDTMLKKAAEGPVPQPKKKEESKNRYMNFVDAVLNMTVNINRLYEKKYKKTIKTV